MFFLISFQQSPLRWSLDHSWSHLRYDTLSNLQARFSNCLLHTTVPTSLSGPLSVTHVQSLSAESDSSPFPSCPQSEIQSHLLTSVMCCECFHSLFSNPPIHHSSLGPSVTFHLKYCRALPALCLSSLIFLSMLLPADIFWKIILHVLSVTLFCPAEVWTNYSSSKVP